MLIATRFAMSLPESNKPTQRMGSAEKRISTRNCREGHILRQKIHTYQKIHDKKIADVSNQLEEIRESMKALTTDPLYGTHALAESNEIIGSRSAWKSLELDQTQGSKLSRRTHGFPEMKYETYNGGAKARNMSFPSLAGKRSTPTAVCVDINKKPKAGRMIKDTRKSKSFDSERINYCNVGKKASDDKEQRHEKLKRCRTAPPVTMQQSFLKTTPEMSKKKAFLSPMPNRLSYQESLSEKRKTRRFGSESPWNNPTELRQSETGASKPAFSQQLRPNAGIFQEMVNVKLMPPFGSESRKSLLVEKGFSDPQAEPKQKPSSDESSRLFQNFKDEQLRFSDADNTELKEQSVKDLRRCRYLRFSTQKQESNRI